MDLTEFLGEFQLEAAEKLDIMATQLLRLERDTTYQQPVREMFLAAHTVKGGAAMLRLTDIEGLAHAVEDLLSSFREGERSLDATTADLLFQSIDQLRSLVTAANPGSVGAEPDPAVERFSARLRGSAAGEPPAVDAAPAPTVRRALLVDDSPTVRELHRMLLEDAGYEIVVCDDGHAALSLALGETFAIVVSGVSMKGMGGLELCAALRKSPSYRAVPVILLSADADPNLARRSTEAGANALVRKGSLYEGRFTETLRELGALTLNG